MMVERAGVAQLPPRRPLGLLQQRHLPNSSVVARLRVEHPHPAVSDPALEDGLTAVRRSVSLPATSAMTAL